MPAFKPIPPKTEFTRLTVRAPGTPYKRPDGILNSTSICDCSCGNIVTVVNEALRSGHTRSCGCLQKEIASETTHGMTGSRIYGEWQAMIKRCYGEYGHQYKDWGGRGIKVCDRWRNSFENFFSDMGVGKKGWSIHRVDNDGNYFLENVVWADRFFQARHTRRNKILTVSGVTACLAELCEKFHVPYARTNMRLWKGWPAEDAFFAPPATNQFTGIKERR